MFWHLYLSGRYFARKKKFLLLTGFKLVGRPLVDDNLLINYLNNRHEVCESPDDSSFVQQANTKLGTIRDSCRRSHYGRV